MNIISYIAKNGYYNTLEKLAGEDSDQANLKQWEIGQGVGGGGQYNAPARMGAMPKPKPAAPPKPVAPKGNWGGPMATNMIKQVGQQSKSNWGPGSGTTGNNAQNVSKFQAAANMNKLPSATTQHVQKAPGEWATWAKNTGSGMLARAGDFNNPPPVASSVSAARPQSTPAVRAQMEQLRKSTPIFNRLINAPSPQPYPGT